MILAFESSCDDTCVAVCKNNYVISNIIGSQILEHQKTQGVVPEVAARLHAKNMFTVLEKALEEANVTIDDIEAIAVANNPGMINCLLTAANTGSYLAALYNKPLIEVNHKLAHVYSCFIDREMDEFEFPIVVLSVSGGHNELYLVKSMNEHELLGSTLDDAAGEAYDKVAKMLGLKYPGGPEISKAALDGDPNKYKLPDPLPHQRFNFSFSGLKTNVKNLIAKEIKNDPNITANMAASFQDAINKNLCKKTKKAFKEFNAREVHLVGGVSANLDLRKKMKKEFKRFKFPKSFNYCTDNAAMVGSLASFIAKDNYLQATDGIKV